MKKLLLVYIVLTIYIEFSETNQCGPIKSFFCEASEPCPDTNGFIIIEVDDTFRYWAHNYHNYLRNEFAGGSDCRFKSGWTAANMMLVEYDLELEKAAECALKKCPFVYNECRRNKRFGYLGQNLYKCIGEDAELLLYTAALLWKEELLEIIQNDLSIMKHFHNVKGITIEHVTQLLWAETTHIGCAKASDPYNNDHYLACHYATSGNIYHEPVFIQGSPRSKCPPGYWRQSRRYPNLCSNQTNEGELKSASLNFHLSVYLFIIYLLCFV